MQIVFVGCIGHVDSLVYHVFPPNTMSDDDDDDGDDDDDYH